MYLIKNADIYAPKHLGEKELLIAGGKIVAIEDKININSKELKIIDAKGMKLSPGFIDTHVHITGGGGEGGYKSIVPPLSFSSFIKAGLTTVLGLLGTDGITRSVENLVAKAKGLKEEGLSVYALTGSYSYPSCTITGDVGKDIVFIDEIIGVKIAISDHRDSSISVAELAKLASAVRVASMISSKAGIVLAHLGDAKAGLKPILELIKNYNVPKMLFRPTHVNRNPWLLEEALDFADNGGYIDLTCGISEQASPSSVLASLVKENKSLDKITYSSDGGGSYSIYDEDQKLIKLGVASLDALHLELIKLVKLGVDLSQALAFITENVSKALNLYPKKGCIKIGSDADILLLADDLSINSVFAKGSLIMQEGKLLRAGIFEDL